MKALHALVPASVRCSPMQVQPEQAPVSAAEQSPHARECHLSHNLAGGATPGYLERIASRFKAPCTCRLS